MSALVFQPLSQSKLAAAQAHFQTYGWVCVPDFLVPAHAEQVREGLLHHSSVGRWHQAAQMNGVPGTQYTQEVPKNLPTIVGNRAAAGARGGAILHYAFSRTLDEAVQSFPPVKAVYDFMRTPELREAVTAITGLPVADVEAIFASRYVTGDFLDPHTDAASATRQLAFVLNLSTNWKEEYGGNLIIQGRTVTPLFNNLVMFDVRNGGRSHYVSQVTDQTNDTRLAVSGWLRSSDGEHCTASSGCQ